MEQEETIETSITLTTDEGGPDDSIMICGQNWPTRPAGKDLEINWNPGQKGAIRLLTVANLKESEFCYGVRIPANAPAGVHTIEVKRHNTVVAAEFVVE